MPGLGRVAGGFDPDTERGECKSRGVSFWSRVETETTRGLGTITFWLSSLMAVSAS